MNAQESMKNDAVNLQSDTLTDLPVTDEQAQQAKGGADSTKKESIVSQTGWFRYSTTNPG